MAAISFRSCLSRPVSQLHRPRRFVHVSRQQPGNAIINDLWNCATATATTGTPQAIASARTRPNASAGGQDEKCPKPGEDSLDQHNNRASEYDQRRRPRPPAFLSRLTWCRLGNQQLERHRSLPQETACSNNGLRILKGRKDRHGSKQ